MSQLTRQRLRLSIDTSRFDQIKDSRTAAAPILWRGDDVAFEIALRRGDDLLDISNFASMTLEVKINDAAGLAAAPLMSRTLTAVDLDPTLSTTTWTDESRQHALFAFTAEETALDLDSELERVFRFTLYGITADTPARHITFGFGLVKVCENGTGGQPFVVPAGSSGCRVKNGSELQLRDTTLNAWRTIWIADGALQLGAPEN